MARGVGPVLAVIDRAADDADVVAEAMWLARAARTWVLLVHVARPVGSGQTDLELRVLNELQQFADQVQAVGLEAHVDDVYFGDTSAEVAYAANRRRASAVVAARRRSRLSGLLAARSRDARLGRLLSVPLVLIDAVAVQPPGVVADFDDLQPSLRCLSFNEETTRDLRQRAA